MDFSLSEEELMFQSQVDELVEKEASREKVRQWDRERRFPKEFCDTVAKQGYLGLLIPEEYGGLGFKPIHYAIFLEGISRYSYDVGCSVGIPMFSSYSLVLAGNEEQKRRYLPPFVNGEIRMSTSVSESEAGSDAASIRTSAIAEGAHFVINGEKIFSSGCHHPNTIIFLTAKTDPSAPRRKGISTFLVPNDTPGIEMQTLPLVARHIGGINEIFLTDVKIPKENLLGGLNNGWEVMEATFDIERGITNAAGYVGNSQTAVSDALEYAKTRKQFGRPICKFQAISHMLVDMQIEVDAARFLVYRVADMVKRAQQATKEASMAKLYASEVFVDVTNKGIQVMGGYGLSEEYDMQRYWREARASTIAGATSQIHRLVIARAMGM